MCTRVKTGRSNNLVKENVLRSNFVKGFNAKIAGKKPTRKDAMFETLSPSLALDTGAL